jgi:hypothetical protein
MPISYSEAPDVKDSVVRIVAQLGFDHINMNGIHCYRSINSKSKAHSSTDPQLEQGLAKSLRQASQLLD